MDTGTATRFTIETEFAADGRVLRDGDAWRLTFTREEMQAERDRAYEEGRQDALVKAEEQSAALLQALEEKTGHILHNLKTEAGTCREQAMELVLLAARKIAGAALEQFPQVRVEELVGEMVKELRTAPRVLVACPQDMPENLDQRLQEIADKSGFEGRLLVQREAGVGPGDVRLEWDQGEVCIQTSDIAERVEKTLRRWLAATRSPDGQGDLFATARLDDEEK